MCFTATRPRSLLFALHLMDYICGLQKRKGCIKHGMLNLTTNLYAKEFARRTGERFGEINAFYCLHSKKMYKLWFNFTCTSIQATFTFLGILKTKMTTWRARYLEDCLLGNIRLNFRKVIKSVPCEQSLLRSS